MVILYIRIYVVHIKMNDKKFFYDTQAKYKINIGRMSQENIIE